MRKIWQENGLSIVLLALFLLVFFLGQVPFGEREYNSDRASHGVAEVSLGEYLRSSHFLEATMENWESEFLQMALYVILTAYLFQKGSSESKTPGKSDPVDRDPRQSTNKKDAPWPVQRGGIVLKLYENSLALAFLLLFVLAFFLHAVGGCGTYNEEQLWHGEPGVSVLGYMATSRFWFESFQNWQSEMLSMACMVIFSIFLRQRGSPESKPVDSPHGETGSG